MIYKFLYVAAFVALASASSCDLPSRFWCDSKKIASECGVELQCAERHWIEDNDAQPVMLDLYFESLCPGCRQFITKMLYPTWKQFLDTKILKIQLYSYGNAKEMKNASTGMWDFTCQHGPQECVGNLIENCIQKYTMNDPMKYFPIFYCMESAQDPVEAAKMCVTKGGLKWSDVDTCAKGPDGNALMHNSAMATDKLNPRHTYVPWVTINGQHTESMQEEAQENLPKLLCDTYKGMKPKQCAEYMEPQPLLVTYRDD
uniref:gamma-interferon-inducible lysosomal thiol reductase-like isoform X1 n=1 Tax=Styela clava TaxID=7725 RepID=UPI00193A8A3E|nr:gamma-interferon-inducible lysosomal thiol reductase-like isoform X1 [Styela clava]